MLFGTTLAKTKKQAFVVRKDSGINSFSDMKGKIIGFQQGHPPALITTSIQTVLKFMKGRAIYRDNTQI